MGVSRYHTDISYETHRRSCLFNLMEFMTHNHIYEHVPMYAQSFICHTVKLEVLGIMKSTYHSCGKYRIFAVVPLLTDVAPSHIIHYTTIFDGNSPTITSINNDNNTGCINWKYAFWTSRLGIKILKNKSKLDMSTACRRLKSPQSLYGASVHPTMVTHRSQSWSWMIDSQSLLSMSISAPTPIPQIRLFQTLTFKLQGQCHGCGQRARPYSQPGI